MVIIKEQPGRCQNSQGFVFCRTTQTDDVVIYLDFRICQKCGTRVFGGFFCHDIHINTLLSAMFHEIAKFGEICRTPLKAVPGYSVNCSKRTH